MANEAKTPVTLLGDEGNVVEFTVDDGTGIAKGTLCTLEDPAKLSSTATTGGFIGIASTEKVASDGSTTLGVWTYGKFDLMTAGGTVNINDPVSLSGLNLIKHCTPAELSSGACIGKALEAAVDGTAEAIQVFVGGFQ